MEELDIIIEVGELLNMIEDAFLQETFEIRMQEHGFKNIKERKSSYGIWNFFSKFKRNKEIELFLKVVQQYNFTCRLRPKE